MPYPPPVPPNTRTNATPMVDNHTFDHNAISDALTEILNHVAALETQIDNTVPKVYGGSTPGGSANPGDQITVAQVTVGNPGYYLVQYTVLLSSTDLITGALRFFVNGNYVFDYALRLLGQTTSVSMSMVMNTPVPNAVISVNMVNAGPQVVNTYADITNHRITAVRTVI